MPETPARDTPSDLAARAVAAVALAALALIHVVDLPDTWTASTLVGSEYVVLVVASVLVAAAMLRRGEAQVWSAAAAIAGSALLAYTLSRTTGIPGDSEDIGNWRCPLGLAALTVESMLLMLAGGALVTSLAAHRVASRPYPRELTLPAVDDAQIEAAS